MSVPIIPCQLGPKGWYMPCLLGWGGPCAAQRPLVPGCSIGAGIQPGATLSVPIRHSVLSARLSWGCCTAWVCHWGMGSVPSARLQFWDSNMACSSGWCLYATLLVLSWELADSQGEKMVTLPHSTPWPGWGAVQSQGSGMVLLAAQCPLAIGWSWCTARAWGWYPLLHSCP